MNQNTDMNFFECFKYYLTYAATHFLKFKQRHLSQFLVHRKKTIIKINFPQKVSVILNKCKQILK